MIFIITGGTKGLGRSLTIKLAAQGQKIFSLYHRDDVSASELRAELDTQSDQVKILKLDITDKSQFADFYDREIKNAEHSVSLIHCASIDFDVVPAQKWSSEALMKLFSINASAFFSMSQILFPTLKKNKNSLLVAITSQTISTPLPAKGFCGYNVAKFALEGLARCFAAEWTNLGIKSITVSPGAMDAGVFQRWPQHIRTLVAPSAPMNVDAAADRILKIVLHFNSVESGKEYVIN